MIAIKCEFILPPNAQKSAIQFKSHPLVELACLKRFCCIALPPSPAHFKGEECVQFEANLAYQHFQKLIALISHLLANQGILSAALNLSLIQDPRLRIQKEEHY